MLLSIGFGAVALLLAVVGIYGVLAYLVAQRNKEIGIRIALGSEPFRIFRLVFRKGAAIVLTGFAVSAHPRQGVGAASIRRNRVKTGDRAGLQLFTGGLGAYSWGKAAWSPDIPPWDRRRPRRPPLRTGAMFWPVAGPFGRCDRRFVRAFG